MGVLSGEAFGGGDGQRGQTDGQIDRLLSDGYLDEMPTLWLVCETLLDGTKEECHEVFLCGDAA